MGVNDLMAPVIALSVAGRASVRRITVAQRPAGKLPATGTPMAAAVGVDITPPPGMPMGGYSIVANNGRGFRTRLKARVVYLGHAHVRPGSGIGADIRLAVGQGVEHGGLTASRQPDDAYLHLFISTGCVPFKNVNRSVDCASFACVSYSVVSLMCI